MFRKLTPLLFALVAAAALTACDKPAPEATAEQAAEAAPLNALEQAAKESDAKPESDRKRAFQYQDPRAGVQKTDPDALKPWKQADAAKAEADKAEGAVPESGTDGKDGN